MQVRCVPHLLHVKTATMSDRMLPRAPPVLYGRSQQPASPQMSSLKECFCYKVLEVLYKTLIHLPPSACLQEPANWFDHRNLPPHTSTVSPFSAYP